MVVVIAAARALVISIHLHSDFSTPASTVSFNTDLVETTAVTTAVDSTA